MDVLLEKVIGINARVGSLLQEARLALRGERNFGVADVRALSAQISEMAAVFPAPFHPQIRRPEMTVQLDFYKAQLTELDTTLQQIRMMLLAQRSQMELSRAHLAAVSNWTRAVQQTR